MKGTAPVPESQRSDEWGIVREVRSVLVGSTLDIRRSLWDTAADGMPMFGA